jgi:hypothetical protein
LREKVDRRASAETDEECSRESQHLTPLEHPSSVAFGDTFSHKKGRRRRSRRLQFVVHSYKVLETGKLLG